MSNRRAICFLVKTANNETFQFAETLNHSNYDIYIYIDDNNSTLPNNISLKEWAGIS